LKAMFALALALAYPKDGGILDHTHTTFWNGQLFKKIQDQQSWFKLFQKNYEVNNGNAPPS
jgi:hypothetical protein